MIIELEIQQFIKEIESKLEKLSDKQYANAKDKVYVLEGAIKEIRRLNQEESSSFRKIGELELEVSKLYQENIKLNRIINVKEKEIQEVKANIT